MTHNTRPTKAPAKLTARFIADTLDRLSDTEARLKTAEDKIAMVLDELQIREYIATNRHGPGDHTFTISPQDRANEATVLPFDKTKD